MTEGGFWPGEMPASEQKDVREPLVAGLPGWSQPEPEPVRASAAPPEPERKEPEPEPTGFEEAAQEPATVPERAAEPPFTPEPELRAPAVEAEPPVSAPAAHAPAERDVPDDVALLEGSPSGADRTVGVVVSRINGEISNRLLASAVDALTAAGVFEERITVMPVPGAFELPIGAMALARTRRYSCVIALGCVIRGETAHFEYIASEAASGLQLAGLETGVPVAFGVLTVDTVEQADERTDKGAAAARAALEMADLFAQLRGQANSRS